jgi:uncharacterized protein
MYYELFLQMKKTLGQLNTWLDKADAFAKEKSFDSNVFVNFRLAPDQLPFVKQVQIACDTAKLGASRLSGKEAPSHADNEQTIAELRTRIQSVISYLDGYSEKDFEGASTRSITQPRWEGKVMTGKDYFIEHVQPNFYFHATHTYAILRNNGVPLGKKDYLGALSQRLP